MDSIIIGINQSVALIVQAVAYVLTFVIILEFVNNTLTWFGDRIGVEELTIQVILMLASVAQLVATRAVNPAKCKFESQLNQHSFRRLTKCDKRHSSFTNGLAVDV